MVHFNFKQGLFQAKGEILQYISEDGKEYVPYDYNFEEDIVPAINNLIPGNETLPIQRELKNIKVFLQGSLVGLCFKGFDFGDVVAAGALFSATGSPYISVLCFIGCRFGVNDGIDIPPAGVGFYDCVFEEAYNVRLRSETPDAPIEFIMLPDFNYFLASIPLNPPLIYQP